MKDGYMIILLFYFVLLTTFFTATTELGSAVTAVINEEITDASSEFTAKDGSTNISTNWSLHRELKPLPNEFPQKNFTETQSNSSVLQKLESNSCEVQVTRFGYKNTLQVVFHEIFCELNKLLHYVLIATQKLKSEFHVVIQYSLTQDAISLHELILNGVLSDIVGRRIVRLEEFLENTKNVKALFDSIRKCISISNVQSTMNRLDIAVTKLLAHIQKTFEHIEFHNDDQIVKNITEKVVMTKNEIISLFHGYLSDNLRDITDLLLATVTWIELAFDAFKIYVQEKMCIYLTALEEFINIVNIFYDEYCASELSRTITYFISSTKELYKLLSSNTTIVPALEDTLQGLTLDRPQNLTLTSAEDSGIRSHSEPIITTYLPINMFNLPVPYQMLSNPIDSKSSTPDKNLPPNNYGQSKYVSLAPTSPTFLDINRTSEDSLASLLGLSYFSPTTMASVNNILQTDANVPSFPKASPLLAKHIAKSDSWSYTISSNPPASSQLPDSLPSLSISQMLNPIIDQNYDDSFNSFIPSSSLIPGSSSKNLKSYVDHSKNADSFKILYTYPEYRNPSKRHMPNSKVVRVH